LSTIPSGPQLGDWKVPNSSVCVLTTSAPCTMRSSMATMVPRPRDSGEAAACTALIRLMGPSQDSSDELRMAP
jgi:hypothetical protein